MDRALALKAAKLLRKADITGPELAQKLGVKYAADAWHLAALGRSIESIDNNRLTDAERLLIVSLAAEHRDLHERGEIRSPKGKHASWRARKSDGWAASVVAKRLGTHRKGEDERWRGTGLNFVNASRNGHMSLTPAGWALVHAMEAKHD